MKNYLKSLTYMLILIVSITFIITLLNYINVINGTFLNILKLIIPIISLFVGGFITGRNSIEKGWLNGLKMGLIIIAIFTLISLISNLYIDLKAIIYYLILLFISIFGSMIGISKKST